MGEGHPAIIHRSFIDANPPYAFSHTATILEIAPKTFLASWVGGPANRDPQNKIWISRRDAELKWSKPAVVAEAEVACFNPVLWKDNPSGEIVLNYKRGTSPENWSGVLLRSKDGGKTWSAPEFLPAGITGAVRSKPFQLDDGTLLCGDSVEAYNAWTCYVNITRDNGRTWAREGPITLPDTQYGIIQPTIFWADEQHRTLRMLVRGSTPVGKVCTATSTDKGLTWSAASPIDALPNPNSAVDAVRLKDGRIALAHNDLAEGKNRLALSLSTDGGAT
ncbi:exo-alpha-sialidase, partial [Candidatus Sumerlaeota bacterium]|nr:exo-alpha-sialidase [Candidatus Sumerlaeota bacterium]